MFSTAADNQTSVEVHVLQGERPMARDNRTLGRFHLTGLPSAPRGVPQIEVTFDIDANGIVNVSAKDKGTGKEQQIRIQASGGLAESDIEQMVREAEQFAEEDKKRRGAAEAKNNAESLIHSTEKQLAEHGDKVSPDIKSEIEKALTEAKEAVEKGDADDMQQKTAALTQAAMKLGEAMYKAQQAETEAAAGPDAATSGPSENPAEGQEEVVDAEFSEVDEENKG
jgi:molecular chaperone DnaK